MGSRLSYFEVTSTDMERAQSFYREMFGWQVMALPEMGGYAVVDTQSGEGGASGGIGPVMDGGAGGIRVYFHEPDLTGGSDTGGRAWRHGRAGADRDSRLRHHRGVRRPGRAPGRSVGS